MEVNPLKRKEIEFSDGFEAPEKRKKLMPIGLESRATSETVPPATKNWRFIRLESSYEFSSSFILVQDVE